MEILLQIKILIYTFLSTWRILDLSFEAVEHQDRKSLNMLFKILKKSRFLIIPIEKLRVKLIKIICSIIS